MNTDQPQAGGTDSSTKRTHLFEEGIRGRKVIAADGQFIGEMSDLVVDPSTWHVEAVQLKLNKAIADALGVHRGKFHAGTIELPVELIQSVGDTVLLSVPATRLRPTVSSPNDAAA